SNKPAHGLGGLRQGSPNRLWDNTLPARRLATSARRMAVPKPLVADCLLQRGVAHGFFRRCGGISRGGYASLNCGLGSKDDPAAVEENRGRVAAFLGADALITAHQVHGATAVAARGTWRQAERPRADAIVTATPRLAVGVLTADCAPVLLADAA